MITVVTSFKLPEPISREKAKDIFLSTAPNYRGVAGLIRKTYVLSEDGASAGGVYLWRSRAAAERMYTNEWRTFVADKYGVDPVVTYFDSPVLVDNDSGKIITDE